MPTFLESNFLHIIGNLSRLAIHAFLRRGKQRNRNTALSQIKVLEITQAPDLDSPDCFFPSGYFRVVVYFQVREEGKGERELKLRKENHVIVYRLDNPN